MGRGKLTNGFIGVSLKFSRKLLSSSLGFLMNLIRVGTGSYFPGSGFVRALSVGLGSGSGFP